MEEDVQDARCGIGDNGVFRWGRDERKREGRFVAGNNGKTAELHWRGNNKEGIARRSETVGYTQEEVTFKSGDLNLAGVVFMPRTAGPHAGVVLVQGSGPGSRDNTFLRRHRWRLHHTQGGRRAGVRGSVGQTAS